MPRLGLSWTNPSPICCFAFAEEGLQSGLNIGYQADDVLISRRARERHGVSHELLYYLLTIARRAGSQHAGSPAPTISRGTLSLNPKISRLPMGLSPEKCRLANVKGLSEHRGRWPLSLFDRAV
jgi:hypothetical protein